MNDFSELQSVNDVRLHCLSRNINADSFLVTDVSGRTGCPACRRRCLIVVRNGLTYYVLRTLIPFPDTVFRHIHFTKRVFRCFLSKEVGRGKKR